MIALLSVIVNQFTAYFARLTAGGTLSDAVQLVLNSMLVSSVVNTTQDILDSNL